MPLQALLLLRRRFARFQAAYQEGIEAVPQRTWNVILASEVDRFQIEQALLEPVFDAWKCSAVASRWTRSFTTTVDIEMGTETFNYAGVTPGKCYAIFPKQKMLEFVHHDLRVDADRPTDISRLIDTQIVGRTRRGVYADIANSVEEITLPT
jgi:hypothetical protein